MFGLPRLHIGLLVGVAVANLAVWLAPDASTFPGGDASSTSVDASTVPASPSVSMPAAGASAAAAFTTSLYQREVRFPDVDIKRGARWQAARVQSGDNLPGLFARRGVRRADISALIEHPNFKDQMRRIRTGALIEYQLDESGSLRTVRYPLNSLETYVFARAGDG
jgi:cell envelope opacity-associated protein A